MAEIIQVNLLPWREQSRQLKKLQVISLALIGFGFVFLILLIMHLYYTMLLNRQMSLNTYLQTEINNEQTTLSNISEEQKQKMNYQDDLHYIYNLYKKSYNAVRVLDEIANLTPSNITINKLIKSDFNIIIEGLAQSQSDISLYMQEIAKSPYFKQPDLTLVNQSASGQEKRLFQLRVEQKG